jgi:D-alanine-D-alanine ligase
VLVEKYLPGREFCISVAGQVTSVDGTFRRSNEPFAFGALERVLAKDELIFTSMDSKPITTSRFKNVDPRESELWTNIHQLAREVFLEFNLGSLIRIDLRADEAGKLHILEANPKPDLKRPSAGVTSLVTEGLAQTDLGYDDLILSLLADRIDFLMRNRRGAMAHIAGLVSPSALDLFENDQLAHAANADTTSMVHSLNSAARRMRRA